MDIIKYKERILEGFKKYKYVWLVLLAGMLLMVVPDKEDRQIRPQAKPITEAEESSIPSQLEAILSHIAGAGRVEVMLTVSQGERTIYQTDSTYTQGETTTDTRTETILVTDSQRNETGLVHQKNPPLYQGAIILAEGAEDPSVKLDIVEAVSDVTGLGTDKITVLKMK